MLEMTRAAAMGGVVLALVGCGAVGSSGPSVAATASGTVLEAYDFHFEPATLSVSAGVRVTLNLKNSGKVEHNLSIPSLGVDTDAPAGQTISVTFTPSTAATTVEFFCKYHRDRGMVGSLTVAGATGAATPAATVPAPTPSAYTPY
ncbi:MAG: cupredoxin domain-containing protein [Candidatus Dormibacteria bacterium]